MAKRLQLQSKKCAMYFDCEVLDLGINSLLRLIVQNTMIRGAQRILFTIIYDLHA